MNIEEIKVKTIEMTLDRYLYYISTHWVCNLLQKYRQQKSTEISKLYLTVSYSSLAAGLSLRWLKYGCFLTGPSFFFTKKL